MFVDARYRTEVPSCLVGELTVQPGKQQKFQPSPGQSEQGQGLEFREQNIVFSNVAAMLSLISS